MEITLNLLVNLTCDMPKFADAIHAVSNILRNGRLQHEIPEFQSHHIVDVSLHPSRLSLIKSMEQGLVGAELGVAEGDFSKAILNEMKPEKLYLIDQWASRRYDQAEFNLVSAGVGAESNVEVIREDSITALLQFPDEYLDFVYIDTTHSYEQTIDELRKSKSKVKKGGKIMGHDYTTGNPRRGLTYGVVQAVHKFCVEEDWRMSDLTLESNGFQSFALQEI